VIGTRSPGPAAPRVYPWGELSALAGIWLGILVYAATFALIAAIATLLGHSSQFNDSGDAFHKAADIARYADQRLAAAAAGNPLPAPPQILGDPVTARIAWAGAILAGALFALVAFVASGQERHTFIRALRLHTYNFDDVWLPGLCAAAAYLGVGLYALAVRATGIDALAPPDTGFAATLRDPVALALYGLVTVIAAPFGEEMLFRGLIFTGLSSWGFWPAALVSSALFAVSHLDPGTFIPFVGVGIGLAAVLRWRGSLWDAILFHSIFNCTSFILLVARG
jgi:membrane protease YdiL (CAAX protease family)